MKFVSDASLIIIADSRNKINKLLLDYDRARNNLYNSPRELSSLFLSGTGRPSFSVVHQIKAWLNQPGMIQPDRALSIATTQISRCYDQFIRTQEYITCLMEPWDPDQPVRGNIKFFKYSQMLCLFLWHKSFS